jgi:hypothetical protein
MTGRVAMITMIVLTAACGSDPGVSREIGARCDTATECDDRCLVPSADFPDGFCTLDCQSSDECPSATSCADRESGICLFDCNFTSDCLFLGPTWECKELDVRNDVMRKVKVCVGA